jgi:hypothetical protein
MTEHGQDPSQMGTDNIKWTLHTHEAGTKRVEENGWPHKKPE